MLRLLLVAVFCISALYSLQSSKPVVIRDAENHLLSVGNLSMKNNTCAIKSDTLLIKNIQFHSVGGYIDLIIFTVKEGRNITVSTNFYKLSDTDIAQLNNLLDINKYYTIKYHVCQNEVNKYNLDAINFYSP